MLEIVCGTGQRITIEALSLEGYRFDGMELHRAVFDGVILNGATFIARI